MSTRQARAALRLYHLAGATPDTEMRAARIAAFIALAATPLTRSPGASVLDSFINVFGASLTALDLVAIELADSCEAVGE